MMRVILGTVAGLLGAAAALASEAYPHPQLPAAGRWAPVLIGAILGLFVAAAAVGLLVRMNEMPEPDDAEAQDHNHGHNHGHGGH